MECVGMDPRESASCSACSAGCVAAKAAAASCAAGGAADVAAASGAQHRKVENAWEGRGCDKRTCTGSMKGACIGLSGRPRSRRRRLGSRRRLDGLAHNGKSDCKDRDGNRTCVGKSGVVGWIARIGLLLSGRSRSRRRRLGSRRHRRLRGLARTKWEGRGWGQENMRDGRA